MHSVKTLILAFAGLAAAQSTAVSVISDGQPQAPTVLPTAKSSSSSAAPVVTVISDGQPQAPTVIPTAKSSTPSAAPTAVSVISDGQPQAPTVIPSAKPTAISVISDGQPQAPTVIPTAQNTTLATSALPTATATIPISNGAAFVSWSFGAAGVAALAALL